jgi:molybdate transport system substrate-binding protein
MTESAHGTALKVISANGMRDVIADIRSAYEASSGHRLDLTVVETGAIRRRVLGGETFDVVIVPRDAADEFAAQGRTAPAATPLIRVNLGLAVPADGSTRDTGTPEALRRVFLTARTVLITDPATGGVSGVHLMEVLEKLGIADKMTGRLVPSRGGGLHAERVVRGEADLAVQAEHEIRSVPGAAFLAYPPEFQRSIVFMAGVGTGSTDQAAAKTFIAFLRGPQAVAAIEARGLTPA